MNTFTYKYPVTVYFGEKAAANNLPAELAKTGKNVLLACGGGSVKKNGIYGELMELLTAAGKTVTEFSGIMSNPTYAKVQEGAKLAKEKQIDFILAVGGGSVIDCCKVISAQAKTEEDIWELETRRPYRVYSYGSGRDGIWNGRRDEQRCGYHERGKKGQGTALGSIL